MWIVIVTQPGHTQHVGPFRTWQDADNWARTNRLDAEREVRELVQP